MTKGKLDIFSNSTNTGAVYVILAPFTNVLIYLLTYYRLDRVPATGHCSKGLYHNDPWTKRAHVNVQNGPLLGQQESRAVARKPRDAAAVLFGLKFADNIRYKNKSSQASKASLSGGPFWM